VKVFIVDAGREARFPARIAPVNRGRFSKPLVWAPSARRVRPLVCVGCFVSEEQRRNFNEEN
jgi:hypothetical protein